jgi:2-oxoisovalerate dehydrogenase E1 component
VQDIERLTGIRSRRWAAAGETPLSLAVDAASQLLTQQRLSIHNLDLVIAATTTPEVITPALACRVAAALAGDAPVQLPAYDVSAACSGYLYALAQAWDFLQQQPDAKVLIVTSEVLSPQLDPGDFETAILFGDAASATLLTGHANADTWLKVHRPTIAGQPEREASIRVPLRGEGMVGIDGKAVFRQAVRAMERALHEACRLAHLNLSEVDLVVPHQANQRIIEALTARTSSHTLSAMAEVGNCSSSSIPLALAQRWAAGKVPQRIACVTVGGGLTSAAFVAERQTHAALRASA